MLDSVILAPGEKERVTEDLTRFRASRQRYRHLGVPYHRGYLFYGPPGTGKTSLVSGLAAAFGMNVYVLNLTDLNDRSLKAAINDVPQNSVILFEDIDCMNGSRRRSARTPAAGSETGERAAGTTRFNVTLSGLLNVLDGFFAPENVIFVMTTNDLDALDPALLRPGRIDYRLFMGTAAEPQKMELYRRFFGQASASEAVRFARSYPDDTMAEFQGRLLQLEHTDSAEEVTFELSIK